MSDESLARLVDRVVTAGVCMHGVFLHMEASIMSGRAAPDAPMPDAILRDLFEGILEQRPEVAEREDLETVTEVLDLILAAIGDELLLVPLDGPSMN